MHTTNRKEWEVLHNELSIRSLQCIREIDNQILDLRKRREIVIKQLTELEDKMSNRRIRYE